MRALDEQIPDLVLLDIMLPDEDGSANFEKTAFESQYSAWFQLLW